MKRIKLILVLAGIAMQSHAQNLTQTIRGNITDLDGKFPLVGATIIILDASPIHGTSADADGNFRFDNISMGRVNLKLSYIGYEDRVVQNVVVTSGKEVVLQLTMQESLAKLDAVVVKAQKEKGLVKNDMALLSAHSVTVEETQRYAGSFNDPARMVSSFAGVTTNPEGNNDIVVRGNSPKYVQWRLEGVEIPNPNHFGSVGSTGGPISALNSNLLANSDFYTGAFAPEYGNVLSGIFDVKFRNGNNEKREYTIGIGALGLDATLEGPFKKGYAGSYLINYRYSSLALLDNAGLVDFGGVPKYQDAAFKFNFPTKKVGAFSLFGMDGISSITELDTFSIDRPLSAQKSFKGNIHNQYKQQNNLYTVGLNHVYSFNTNTFIETTIAYSGSSHKEDESEERTGSIFHNSIYFGDSTTGFFKSYQSSFSNSSLITTVKLSSKLNAKNKIEVGVKNIYNENDYLEQFLNDYSSKTLFTSLDLKNNMTSIRGYIGWKHRLNEDITIVSGVHNFYLPLTGENSLEPRASLKWQLKNGNSFNAGLGRHSTMEHVSTYFAKVIDKNGLVSEPNKNLKLLKANHFVLGYEKRFTSNLLGKVEAYYQGLSDLPVKNDPTSYYSTINESDGFRDIALVSKGTGQNYGLEFTLERFFANNYYYMFSSSIYQSKYKSLENIERNTRFNGNYAFNALVGKEFDKLGKKQNKTIDLNAKFFYLGAQKIIPLLRNDSGELAVDLSNDQYRDYSKAYDYGLDDIFQINASASLKINKRKTTHEILVDVINANNTKAKIYEYYEPNLAGKIEYSRPLSLIPNLIYRVYF
jgi:hypothetical protein